MTYFPACAGSEEEGPTNFTPPVTGSEVRLMESRRHRFSVLEKLTRETAKFHETMALKHGLDSTRGLAHYRIAKAHREAKTKLQEFIDDPKRQVGGDNSELGELDPKAIIAANTAAVKFHKQSADKAGLDTDEGHAHVAAMEHHADIIKQAQQLQKKNGKQGEAKFGHSSKKSPFPGVPRKKDMPNEDIRQDKPALPLRKLQQQKASQYLAPRYEKSHQSEGGPGSGPKKSGGTSRFMPSVGKAAQDRAGVTQRVNRLRKLATRFERAGNKPDALKMKNRINALLGESRQ